MFNKLLLFTTTAWGLASFISVILLFVIWRYSKKALTLKIEHIFLVGFLLLFWVSFFFRLQPTGYQEFIAYSVGPICYLLLNKIDFVSAIEKYRNHLSWLALSLVTLLSIWGIVEFIPSLQPRLSSLFIGVEPYSTYPNTLALLLVAIIPLAYYLFSVSKQNWQRVLAYAFLVINSVALFLTFSRGALIALCGAVIIVVLSQLFQQSLKKGLPIFLAVILTISFGVGFNQLHTSVQPAQLAAQVPTAIDISDRLTDQTESADQSTDERIQFWLGSLEMIKSYPVFGIGSGGFKYQYPKFQQELLATSDHPHNQFLKLAVENGLITAVFFYIFLAIIWVRHLFQVVKKPNTWQVALFTSFTAMNLHLLVDYNLNAVLIWAVYWLLISLLSTSKNLGIKLKSKPVNITLSIVLIGITVVSAWHLTTYKSANQSGPFYEALNNPELTVQKFPHWPNAYFALAEKQTQNQDYQAALNNYSTAITLNKLNNLDWHYVYLSTLLINNNKTIAAKANEYYQLINDYNDILQLNSHNTIASENPQFAEAITNLYIDYLPTDQLERWQVLKSELQKNQKIEQCKFDQLFYSKDADINCYNQ